MGGQVRSFTYDNLGFLRDEVHPENGQVLYGSYDARGNVGTRRQGSANSIFDLNFSYDSGERLTSVYSRNPYYPNQFRISKEFFWNSLKGDLLDKASRYNYQPILGLVKVIESYEYSGTLGLVNKKTTEVLQDTGGTGQNYVRLQDIDQNFDYNDLGQRKNATYPKCNRSDVGKALSTKSSSPMRMDSRKISSTHRISSTSTSPATSRTIQTARGIQFFTATTSETRRRMIQPECYGRGRSCSRIGAINETESRVPIGSKNIKNDEAHDRFRSSGCVL